MVEAAVRIVWGGLLLVLARWLQGRAQLGAWPYSFGTPPSPKQDEPDAARPPYRSVTVFIVRIVGFYSIGLGLYRLIRSWSE